MVQFAYPIISPHPGGTTLRPFNFSSLALSPQRPFLHRIHHLFLLGLLTTALLLGGSLGTFALPAAQSQAHCENLDYLLINPSFETQTGWELVSADYSTVRAYLSTQSMRLGIVDTDNVPSISYIQVTINLPASHSPPPRISPCPCAIGLSSAVAMWAMICNMSGCLQRIQQPISQTNLVLQNQYPHLGHER